jgi:hypothetical protein
MSAQMTTPLQFTILPQPDDTTCGPTCLHAVYQHFGDPLDLDQVIGEVARLEEGGTLGALLGTHALARGYRAMMLTYNLEVFDPTWFAVCPSQDGTPQTHSQGADNEELINRLRLQMAAKQSPRLNAACEGYMDFLRLGGRIRLEDLSGSMLLRFLEKGIPILTGLSATYLYRCPREFGLECVPDDIRGYPTGHFVVLCGFDRARGTVSVADPYLPNPLGERHHYEVELDRLVCAILLGVLTYDANLLVVTPPGRELPVC